MQPGRDLDVWLGRHLLNRKVRYMGATKPGDIATSMDEWYFDDCKARMPDLLPYLSTTYAGMGMVKQMLANKNFCVYSNYNPPNIEPKAVRGWTARVFPPHNNACVPDALGKRHPWHKGETEPEAVALAAYNALSGTAEGEKDG